MKQILTVIFCCIAFNAWPQVQPGMDHFRVPRPLPFRDIGETKKVFLSEFTRTETNATTAISKALIALSEMEGKAELIFDVPHYELESSVDGGFFFRIKDMRDIL